MWSSLCSAEAVVKGVMKPRVKFFQVCPTAATFTCSMVERCVDSDKNGRHSSALGVADVSRQRDDHARIADLGIIGQMGNNMPSFSW